MKTALEGVWQFVEASVPGQNARTIDHTKPGMGGLLLVTGRHFAYVLMTGDTPRPPLPQGGALKATADELRATWGPFDAQAGTFEINGTEVTARAAAAKGTAAMQPET